MSTIAIIASSLVGTVSLTGVQQAQSQLTGMGASTKSAQADLAQLQAVANDVSNVVQNRFAVALRDSQGSLQALAQQAADAGIDTSKLSELQAKAAVAADNLAIAQDKAAAALQKAANITIDAASSEDQIIAAQNQASLAADKVAIAQNNAAAAMGKLGLEATEMSTAVAASSEKTSFFGGMMATAQEKSAGFFGGIKEGVGGLLDFGSKVGMTIMGVQMMATMFIGAADAAGKMIGDFQQGLTKLVTTAGESAGNVKMVGDGMLAMAGPTATSVKNLGDAMYWVESGGAHGSKALEDLKIAAMGAKAENADLTDVTKALMFTLNNYGDTGLTAAQAMNTLITATGEGELTLQGLAGAVSNVMPTAHAFGISLTDVTAGLATMSSQGDDASAAATHLAMMIKTIEAPSDAGASALKSIGLTTQQVSNEMRVSMPGALELIVDHLKNKFPEGSTAYNEALKAISGGSRSMQAILETTGSHLDVFKQNVDKITGAVKAGGDGIAGWADVQQNFNFKMDQAKDAVGALAIKMGTALAPAATALVGFFVDKAMPALNSFSDWFISTGIPAIQRFPKAVSDFFAPLSTAIGWLNDFVGHGQAAIPIISGIGGAILVGLTPAILALLPPLGAMAIEVIAATWPFVAAAVAIGGLTAVFLHFYSTNAGFRDFIASIGEAMKGVWAFLVETFTPVWLQLQEVWKNQMQPAISQLIDTFKQMEPELKVIAEILGGVLLYQIGIVVADLGFLFGALAGIWKGAAEMIGGFVQIFSGYIQVIAGIISFIIDLFTGKFSKLGPDLKVILGGIGEIFSGFGNVLKGIVDGIVGGVVGGFKGMATSVIGYLNDIVHGTYDSTQKAKDDAAANTLQMKDKVLENAQKMNEQTQIELQKMRLGIEDQLKQTTDSAQKQTLQMKLNTVNASIETAQTTGRNIVKSREDNESELDKLKASSAQKWGTIQQDIQTIFGNIGHWFSDRWHDIQNIFGGIGAWFHDRWQEAWNGTTAFFGTISKWFGDRWHEIQGVFGAIGQWFSDRWHDVMQTTAPFRDYMGAVFQTIWNILVALWGKLGQWFNDRWHEVMAFLAPIGQWFADKFTEAWHAVVGAFQFLGKWFSDRWEDTKKILGGVGQWFHDRFTEAWNEVVKIWTPIGKWFSDRWVDVQNIFKAVGNWFHDRFTEAWNKVVEIFTPIGKWFSDRWNDVMGGVNRFKDSVVGKFTDTKNAVTNVFHDMINGIVDHLNDGISAIESFINFFGQGLDNIATSLGTKGTIPVAHLSRIPHYATGTDDHPGGLAVLGEYGRELVSLPKGSKVAPNDITESLLAMLGGTGKIPGYAAGIGDLGAQIAGWISGGAKSILDNVMNALNIHAPALTGMENIATGMLNKVKDWALGWIEKIMPKFDFSGGAGGTAVNVPGTVQSWILSAMGLTGTPGNWAGPLGVIAMSESGGNPNAINRTDSNAIAGHPSQGLFQTIPSTFAAHALPGHTNILNPIDNAAAAIGYIVGRYGTVFNVPGIVSMSHGGAYVGYSQGGVIDEPIAGMGLRTGTKYAFGEHGKELVTPYVPSGVNLAQSYSSQSSHAPSAQQGQGQNLVLQVDGHTFARIVLPYVVTTVRNTVGVWDV